MKKKLLLLLVAVCVVSTLVLAACGEAPSISFVAPTKLHYEVGETLDLTGAKLVTYNADGTQDAQDVTTAMLDQATLPNFAQSGEYTVKGSVENFDFSFKVTVHSVDPTVAFVSPATKTYLLGSTLDLTGGSITINGTKTDLTTAMLDATTLPNMEAEGTYVVKGTHNGVNFQFSVAVTAPIQVKVQDGFVYQRTQNLDGVLQCRTLNADGVTFTDWYDVSSQDIESYTVANGTLTANLAFLLNNKVVRKTVTAPVDDTYLTVSQLKAKPAGTQALVNGVIVSFATAMSRDEFIIADKATGEMIGIGGMEGQGLVYNYNVDTHGFEVGDEIIVPVEVRQGDSYSDLGKIYATYRGGEAYSTAVLSKDNTVAINKTTAVEIDSQADLLNFLSDANITGNHYKMVKFRGQLNFILYASSDHLRFWFEDGNIDNYEAQCTSGTMSPCFNNGSQYYTTGATFNEMVLKDANAKPEDWSNPATQVVEIYALFIGGNAYYHEFVILSQDDVTHLKVTKTDEIFTSPTVVSYPLNATLNLAGAKITRKFDIRSDEEIAVTADMLDATTLPDFTTAGTYTVKGSYEGFAFQFDVQVKDIQVKSIAIDTQPSKLVYTHRDNFETLDLTGGKLQVTYTDDSFITIDMDETMLPASESPNWGIGQVTYQLTYAGCTTDLVVTFNSTAISVAEFKQGTVGEKYEVHAVIVGVQSSQGAIETIVKDVNSNECIGVYNSGVADSISNPVFKADSNVKRGDEVIITLTLKQNTTAGNVNCGKKYADGSIKNSAIILSENKALNWDLSAITTVLDTQQKLIDFLTPATNFYQWVKIVTPMTVMYSGNWLRIYMDSSSVTSLPTQKVTVNGVAASPVFHVLSANSNITGEFKDYFTNVTGTTYTNNGSTTYEFYALFVGGNAYYHIFAVLDDCMIVNTAV